MEDLFEMIQALRLKKGWDKLDTPLRLSKALHVESAELLECFLDENPNREAIEAELADILFVQLSMCYDLSFDVKELLEKKLKKVDEKYADA